MAQAHAGGQVLAEVAEAGEGGELRPCDEVEVELALAAAGRVQGQGGEALEQRARRVQGHCACGHLRRRRVVQDLCGVLEGADAGGEEQADRGAADVLGVVQDGLGGQVRVHEAGLDAVLPRVAGDGGALGGRERGRHRDVRQPDALALADAPDEHLGRVDDGAAADGAGEPGFSLVASVAVAGGVGYDCVGGQGRQRDASWRGWMDGWRRMNSRERSHLHDGVDESVPQELLLGAINVRDGRVLPDAVEDTGDALSVAVVPQMTHQQATTGGLPERPNRLEDLLNIGRSKLT